MLPEEGLIFFWLMQQGCFLKKKQSVCLILKEFNTNPRGGLYTKRCIFFYG
jgi:hypothetical protein